MSLLKIDKTKGKEFVLDYITFRSFQSVKVLMEYPVRFYENLRSLSVKHKCIKMRIRMLIQKVFQLICDIPKDTKGPFTNYVDTTRVVLWWYRKCQRYADFLLFQYIKVFLRKFQQVVGK